MVREDHRRNHEKILVAALETFDECGLDAPLSDVAALAGVSSASLYRHFPGRDSLLRELYDRCSTEVSDIAIAALERPDASPSKRLDNYFDALMPAYMAHPCYPQLAGRGLRVYPGRVTDPRLLELLSNLIVEAQAAGVLAEDVIVRDLVTMPLMVSSLTAFEQVGAGAVWRRQLAIARRGLAHPKAFAALPAEFAPR